MAAGAFIPYDQGLLATQNGNIDFLAGIIVAVLLDETYTPDKAADATYADISATEILDADYDPVVVGSKTIAMPTGDETVYGCANIAFGNPVTIEAKYCVLVQRAGGALASTDLLLGYGDLNTATTSATASSTASAFSVNTPNGLFGINNVDV